MNDLDAKNVGMYYHQPNIDSTTPSGRVMLQIACVFAEVECEMFKVRVLASHERVKEERKTIGRLSMINDALKTSIKFIREKSVDLRKITPNLNVGVEQFLRRLRHKIKKLLLLEATHSVMSSSTFGAD